MKALILFGVVATFVLSSCGTQDANTPVGPTVPVVNYPTTQAETPATEFCTSRGGTVSIEKEGTGGVETAYCNFPEGNKVDAWKFMSDNTQTTGTGM